MLQTETFSALNSYSFMKRYFYFLFSGCCNPKADPAILKEGPTTAWVDGNNGLGVVVGTFRYYILMELILELSGIFF
jgi:LDH2 family malate/lactate/ureidoglycolate dehydrogenase